MAIALLVTAVWILGMLTVVAICRSAARGDHAQRIIESPWRDSHERSLAA